jgi:hypothetical protein
VEPYGNSIDTAFICHECLQAEAAKIWEERQAQHSATYPPMVQMTQQQYDQWYLEHRQLEADFSRDQRVYEMELKAKTRPSNICSTLEDSKDEMDFASEIDSLSLSLMGSHTSNAGQAQPRSRVSLATDASENLHWGLNGLAIDRGACGIEYSPAKPGNGASSSRQLNAEELWKKPRSE